MRELASGVHPLAIVAFEELIDEGLGRTGAMTGLARRLVLIAKSNVGHTA